MDKEKKFAGVPASPSNPMWGAMIRRETPLYRRDKDVRSEFARDYNRILHCTAYRRLKRKTQVFFATENDHICTRIEHVNHVVAVSHTISGFLGLNNELTNAIAIGHDLGHAPFGHEGEKIVKAISRERIGETFWHERNSLWFVDRIETLTDNTGKQKNLNLTYAVRDGILSHCGEVDENAIAPRRDAIELYGIKNPSQYPPFTWEGCVVKIADKISYLGRDIEDALAQRILSLGQLKELARTLKESVGIELKDVNNAEIMHKLIMNLCEWSHPDKGLGFSKDYFNLLTAIKRFNYRNIYGHPRLTYFKRYAKLIIESIFDRLLALYKRDQTLRELEKCEKLYPLLVEVFSDWLIKYADLEPNKKKERKYANDVVYEIGEAKDYTRAIIHFIAGMTDSFAIRVFQELTRFQ